MAIPVIVLFAPTATGKTALSLKLFGKGSFTFFKGKAELISADSMQVYRQLDIGTAKPTADERALLPHHLIDILNYDEQFSVSDFISMADSLCADIWGRGKIPLVVGGTGFYIRSFLMGLPATPESDENVRLALKKRIQNEGRKALHDELRKLDPFSAEKININDEYRIIRALEVYALSGKPRSSFSAGANLRNGFDFLTFVLERDRKELYERIEKRVDEMFESGLKAEVESLIRDGADSSMPGMKAIGYREWFSGDRNSSEGIEKIRTEIKHSSRKYAKKQLTFMADIPGAKRIFLGDESASEEKISLLVQEFLSKYGQFY